MVVSVRLIRDADTLSVSSLSDWDEPSASPYGYRVTAQNAFFYQKEVFRRLLGKNNILQQRKSSESSPRIVCSQETLLEFNALQNGLHARLRGSGMNIEEKRFILRVQFFSME
ncbi:hypothetical protein TNIN_463891 [Trichonephila inaurata madagascariensis]|uniref:Uncharacterized protein n=1 Tax=Trichonephila inaurata madagascariensis TaxID=2747483 RepID=A0A8X6Y1V7_9ARAC|nr:hypothetical protein TNIN_463891 [Trichonephila inaurata madagascariensis]